jgi:hypothetical protein
MILGPRGGQAGGDKQGARAGRKKSAAQEFFLRRHAILPNDLILSNGRDAKAQALAKRHRKSARARREAP